jgi:SAM-dependent methyltransferase
VGFYQDKIDANGAAQKAGWRSEIERSFRFEWISHVIEKSEFTNLSILDIGCADGALIDHLNQNEKMHYVGVEVLPHFLTEARRNYPHIEFLEGDFRLLELPASDVVVALGTTIGDQGPTTPNQIYDAAKLTGTRIIALSTVAGPSTDPALVTFAPPPLASGWIRTMGPPIHGEHLWVDAVVEIPRIEERVLFERAQRFCDSRPGPAAMLAARLGLTDIVAALLKNHPNDDHVKLAVEWSTLLGRA